jgi:hypothetical protein
LGNTRCAAGRGSRSGRSSSARIAPHDLARGPVLDLVGAFRRDANAVLRDPELVHDEPLYGARQHASGARASTDAIFPLSRAQ